MRDKKKKAFTLIELLVVIAIIGLLAGAISVAFSSARKKARDKRRMSDLKNIEAALTLFYDTYNRWPMEKAPDSANGKVGEGSKLDSLLTGNGFMSKIPADPSGPGDAKHYYYYDGAHWCNGGAYGTVAVIFANLMESEAGKYDDCPTGMGSEGRSGNFKDAYNIVLGPSSG